MMRFLWYSFVTLVIASGLDLAVPVYAASEATVDQLADQLEKSVVKLDMTKQPWDVTTPWQRQDVRQSRHLGVVLSGHQILTTAFAVADASLIEMQRFGSSRRHTLEVSFVDYEANIALLRPLIPEALVGLEPLSVGDDLSLGARVSLLKARDDYQLVRISASLQEVGTYRAVTSSYSLPSYLFKLQQSGLGWSEPIVDGRKLVGLSTGQDANYLHALPMSVIKHVLNDDLRSAQEGGKYRGFPSIGITLAPLVSPDYRRLLKAGDEDDGVRIASVQEDSSFKGKLQPDDVIMTIAGQKVSDQGFVVTQKWGQIQLKYILSQLYSGDEIELGVRRDGKDIIVKGPVSRYNSNRVPISYYLYDKPVPYIIFGGLVFEELSRDYLQQWGKDWRDYAPADLLYMLDYENDPLPDASQRHVVLSRVLADQFNRGYEDLKHVLLDTVNGEKVHSLAQVIEVLRDHPVSRHGRRFAVFTFRRGGGDVILAYDGLKKAHNKIAKTYEITSPEAFFRPPQD